MLNLKIKTTTLMCLSSAKQHQFAVHKVPVLVLANITYPVHVKLSYRIVSYRPCRSR